MKKIITAHILCFSLFCGISFSQSYSLNFFKMNAQGNPKDFMVDSIIVKNTGTQDIIFFINRLAKNIPLGWESCF